MEYLSNKLSHGIRIINTDEHYGKDKDKHIMLYKCLDNEYEPVVYRDGKTHFVFKENSYLLK